MEYHVCTFESFSQEDMYKAYEELDSLLREESFELIKNVVEKNIKRQPWKVVSFPRVKKIWQDHAFKGILRDEKGMNDIAYTVINNIVKLYMNTVLCGHSTDNPKQFIENNVGYYFKGEKPMMDDSEELSITYEEFEDRTDEYFYDENWKQWRISDYAMEPLLKKAKELILAKTAEEKMLLVDQVFNIVHARGDIASLFVEGGSAALSELSGAQETQSG